MELALNEHITGQLYAVPIIIIFTREQNEEKPTLSPFKKSVSFIVHTLSAWILQKKPKEGKDYFEGEEVA